MLERPVQVFVANEAVESLDFPTAIQHEYGWKALDAKPFGKRHVAINVHAVDDDAPRVLLRDLLEPGFKAPARRATRLVEVEHDRTRGTVYSSVEFVGAQWRNRAHRRHPCADAGLHDIDRAGAPDSISARVVTRPFHGTSRRSAGTPLRTAA